MSKKDPAVFNGMTSHMDQTGGITAGQVIIGSARSTPA